MPCKPDNHAVNMDLDDGVHRVNVLVPVQRWTANESLHCTTLMVPAIIVAYNMLINSLDQMSQRRATKPAHQKKQQLHMSVFIFILDLPTLQAFALHQVLDDGLNVLGFVSFKRSICERLGLPHSSQQKHRRYSEKEN
jgi:hypothetical protein